MVGFIVEIQNCVKVRVEADNPEEARMNVVNDMDLWNALLINPVIHDARQEVSE